MGFFDLFKQSNINQGIEEYKRTDDAVLLDVRTPQEYQEGHTKNAVAKLNNIALVVKNRYPCVCILLFQVHEAARQLGYCNEWDILK